MWRVVIDPLAEAEARDSFRWYLDHGATSQRSLAVLPLTTVALRSQYVKQLLRLPYPVRDIVGVDRLRMD
jgi:hypothetical protein